jgi:CTP synthase
MTKFIFITGGVVSSLGKGVACASIGRLLESRGFKVRLLKLDPYVNVDPGTMSPFQHGEVYVTDDGAETDLDIGHYERFTDAVVDKGCNFTTGMIYYSVISKERRGDYLGGTVQVVPHITDEIKSCVVNLAKPDIDVVITEVGGTVGDIEGLPFLEALRQLGQDVGRENRLYIHLTLIVHMTAAGEIKTKPTQHSVGRLREIGIQPDMLICRTEKPLPHEARDKISLFCNVDQDAVIEGRDFKYSVYEVPVVFAEQGLDDLIVSRLGLEPTRRDMRQWNEMLGRIRNPESTVEIAVIGKYIQLPDAYKSIYEALDHAGIANRAKVIVRRVEAEELQRSDPFELLRGVQGILVPGGFGYRGIEGKVAAVRYARENGIPLFGICLGLHCASIDFARHVCGLENANSTEFDPDTPHPVICHLPEQRTMKQKGGTMRLGAYPCVLKPGTKARSAYGTEKISERHRHRLEFNNYYRELFERHGAVFSGLSPDGDLAEIMELKDHPWFVTVQYHPEFKSKPVNAHPLFRDFVAAAMRMPRRE